MNKIVFTVAVAAFISTGCTQAEFGYRASTLKKSVMSGGEYGSGDSEDGSVNQPGTGGESGGGVPQPGTGGEAGGTVPQFPVKFRCGADVVMQTGTSVRQASALQLKVTDSAGNVACDVTSGVRESVIAKKAVDLSKCNLPGNSYNVQIFDTAKPAKDLFYTTGYLEENVDHVTIKRADSSAPWKIVPKGIPVTLIEGLPYADNSVVALAYDTNPIVGGDGEKCDIVASPLVINMTNPGDADPGMQLTHPEQGVMFDILGLNSFPVAHTKKPISWIQNPNYMFLALPQNASVDSVDQLFGNNTAGPDYTFAENGFAALAKYDANNDGLINKADPIFLQLRLWSDRNRDGVSQVEELKALGELGLTEIDLNYDKTYFEQDQYGNQSRYRSTVSTASGHLHVIFDLWFTIP